MSSGPRAEARFGLRVDTERSSEQVEVVDVGGAEIGLQRAEDARQRDAFALRLVPIHVRVQLRHGVLEARVRRGREQLGLRARSRKHFARHPRELVVAGARAILNVELESAGAAESLSPPAAARRGHRHRECWRTSRRVLARYRRPTSSLLPRSEKSSSGRNITAAFSMFTKPFTDSPGKPIACSMPGVASASSETCRTTSSVRSSDAAFGSCTMRDQVSLVLRRDEASRHDPEHQPGAGKQQDEHAEDDASPACHVARHAIHTRATCARRID